MDWICELFIDTAVNSARTLPSLNLILDSGYQLLTSVQKVIQWNRRTKSLERCLGCWVPETGGSTKGLRSREFSIKKLALVRCFPSF
jgi:hypothetical protein